ncbi:MAG: thioredoxin family protein, partial [Pseudomonadota bacterium]
MNRRRLLGTALTAALLAAAPKAVLAGDAVAYTPGVIETALAEGKVVMVRYGAKWCTTCARQERVMAALRAEDPAYDQAITFVDVDWDEFRSHAVTKDRNVPRR